MEKKTHHRAKKKRDKKQNNSKKNKEIDAKFEDGVNVSDTLYPIAHYLNDKEEMIKQIFSVMEKEKLNCMLPPILKDMSMKSLMESCLRELKTMTDDEVLKVLQGELLETTSSMISSRSQSKPESEASISSDKQVHDSEDEKKTLLDILEQEMQEIAYSTILQQDQDTSTSANNAALLQDHDTSASEDDFPEIVAVTETKQKDAVPLICIDCEDGESAAHQKDSSGEGQYEVIDVEDGVGETYSSFAPSGSVTICENGKSSGTEEVENLASKPESQSNIEPSTNITSMKVQENFVIQVFSDKETNLERVVMKVPCSPLAHENVNSGQKRNVSEEGNNTVLNVEECHARVLTSSPLTSKATIDDNLTVIEIQEDLKSHESTLSVSQPRSGIVRPVPSLCKSKSDTHLQHTNLPFHIQISENLLQTQSKVLHDDEKEEGEITEESDEVEFLEAVTDDNHSPTICLSSDGSEVERPASESNQQKHHMHRHRKKNSESPEQPGRHIDRRGNRSYRRKKSKSTRKEIPEPVSKSKLSGESSMSSKNSPPSSPNKDAGRTLSETSNKSPSQACTSKIDSARETVISISENSDIIMQFVETIEDTSNANVGDTMGNLETEPSINKDGSEDEGGSLDNSEVSSSKSSWADRWAQKKDLKKVVITSKICRNVRKKILSARKKEIIEEKPVDEAPLLPPVPPLVLHVEGSVQEYEMLQCLVSDERDSEIQTLTLSELETINLPPESGLHLCQNDEMKSLRLRESGLETISLPPTPIKSNSSLNVDVLRSLSANQDELNSNSELCRSQD